MFRRQAIEAREREWLGEVVLVNPVRAAMLNVIAALVSVASALAVAAAAVSKPLDLTGWIVGGAGVSSSLSCSQIGEDPPDPSEEQERSVESTAALMCFDQVQPGGSAIQSGASGTLFFEALPGEVRKVNVVVEFLDASAGDSRAVASLSTSPPSRVGDELIKSRRGHRVSLRLDTPFLNRLLTPLRQP